MRKDGRKPDEFRPIKITPHYIKYAEGSTLIELGNTRVICTATVEESVPQFLKNSGMGWVTAEYGMIPRSCSTRLSRQKDSGRTYEIQRLVGRSLRAVTDLKNMGDRTVWIDCDVIQADGGTRTTSITGSFIALCFAFDKLKKSGLISKIPVKDIVAATSVGIVNDDVYLDLNYEEDSRADVDMNVVMTGKGEFVEIQGTSERKPFSKRQMDSMLSFAKEGIGQLVIIQKKILKNIL
ncbi:MAG: ribonuclease PH [Candidatus Omnitrophica bacterium]|nr:ribonuclease PH [Candidatus Omnitrophota bacterium]